MNNIRKPTLKGRKVSTALLLFIILLGMVAAITIIEPKFFTAANIFNLLRQTAINGVIAVGMTLVIISAGIDLSVGASVGLSGILVAVMMTSWNLPIWLSVILAIVSGGAVGLFNGIVIHDGKVPAFIATLGTMTAVRGVIMISTNAKMVSGLPDSYTAFAQARVAGVPALLLVWFVVLVVTALMLKFTAFGRNIYAVGSNVEAARLSGISIRKTIYGVYVFCGILCGIAGVMYTARLGNGVPTGGIGFETDAIASAVIGGASLSGAEGTVIGTVLGSLIMQVLKNGGNLMKINPFIMEIVIGLLIIAAVLIDKRRKGNR